jgi:hypothetical protein
MPQTNNLQSDLRVGGSVIRAIHNPEASVAQSADDLVVVGIVLVLDRHLGVNLNTKDTANSIMHIKISNTVCSYFNSIAISVLPQRHYVSQAVLWIEMTKPPPHTHTLAHTLAHRQTHTHNMYLTFNFFIRDRQCIRLRGGGNQMLLR